VTKKKLKCMICGKNIKTKIKLPHGSLRLCPSQQCLDEMNFHANNGAVPVVWSSMEDLINHDEATEEIARPLVGDVTIATQLAREVGDYIWGGETLEEMWHEALDESIGTLEEFLIQRIKDEDLPLFNPDKLTTEKGKNLLEQRLKGESHDKKSQ
jgi:hypothetical protein